MPARTRTPTTRPPTRGRATTTCRLNFNVGGVYKIPDLGAGRLGDGLGVLDDLQRLLRTALHAARRTATAPARTSTACARTAAATRHPLQPARSRQLHREPRDLLRPRQRHRSAPAAGTSSAAPASPSGTSRWSRTRASTTGRTLAVPRRGLQHPQPRELRAHDHATSAAARSGRSAPRPTWTRATRSSRRAGPAPSSGR